MKVSGMKLRIGDLLVEQGVLSQDQLDRALVEQKQTGKILSNFSKGYACTRFSLSGPYVLGCNMDMIDTSSDNKLVSSGPPVDVRECVGAVVSNGRIFYTAQASGLQVSQVCGAEAASFTPPWQEAPAR